MPYEDKVALLTAKIHAEHAKQVRCKRLRLRFKNKLPLLNKQLHTLTQSAPRPVEA